MKKDQTQSTKTSNLPLNKFSRRECVNEKMICDENLPYISKESLLRFTDWKVPITTDSVKLLYHYNLTGSVRYSTIPLLSAYPFHLFRACFFLRKKYEIVLTMLLQHAYRLHCPNLPAWLVMLIFQVLLNEII